MVSSVQCHDSLFKSSIIAIKRPFSSGRKWFQRVLSEDTDLISSLGVLVATTCFLASKIFQKAPDLLPRLAIIILNRGVIIWVNSQWKDLKKTCIDILLLKSWFQESIDWNAWLVTSLKVFVKGVDLLLTCGMFAASSLTFFGYSSRTLFLIMRPFALSSLLFSIGCKVYDYCVDKALVSSLKILESSSESHCHLEIYRFIKTFLEILILPISEQKLLSNNKCLKEKEIALKVVRQLDVWTKETFCQSIRAKHKHEEVKIEAMKLFYSIKEGLVNKHAAVHANLSLMVLGYLAMGVSRSFPDSIADMSSRWVMSVLYTDEMIKNKLFQSDLKKAIEASG